VLPPLARPSLARLLTGVLLCCPALAACGDADSSTSASTDPGAGAGRSSGLAVEVDPNVAPPGGTVAARVLNETEQEFTYGAGYELEREGDGGWQQVELPDRPVIEIGYLAKPGGKGPPVQVQIPPDAEPGSWRVVIQRDVPGVGDLSGEFQVSDTGG
jgi:hypothetical protein